MANLAMTTPTSTSAPSPARIPITVSATLAANEALARRRRRGERVLPLAFGEAGLPVHPLLRARLADAAGRNAYGPVAGLRALREAAAGYWDRRRLPTSPDDVVCGPGSKPLLYGLLLALGADVAVPKPSWVSYAAQAAMINSKAHFVATRPGEGGVPDPARLDQAVTAARAGGRHIASVVVTLPDNPTGTLASPGTVRDLCEVAAKHDLVIISDEIYRDLLHEPAPPVTSPAEIAPERTVVTTALSKNLAVGGWRIGVARLPGAGRVAAPARRLLDRLLSIGSEIWSAPSGPIQQAAAFAFGEPPELAERVARSRRLHATMARAVAARMRAAGITVPPPRAAFYVYPDFGPWRELLLDRYQVSTAEGLAALLFDRYAVGVLPASAFGEAPEALRLRVATGLLYGDSVEEREAALLSANPLELPWVSAALARLEYVLADLRG
jgi:aspartate aminotransferase